MKSLIAIFLLSVGALKANSAPLVNGQDVNGAGQWSFQAGSTVTLANAGNFSLGSSTSGVANALDKTNLVAAWAIWVGTNTVGTASQIFSSHNVASVFYSATGVYIVNFGLAFASNVSYTCTCNGTTTTGATIMCEPESSGTAFVAKSAGSIQLNFNNASAANINTARGYVICVGYQ